MSPAASSKLVRRNLKRLRTAARLCQAMVGSGRDAQTTRSFLQLRRQFDATPGWCSVYSLGIWDLLLSWQAEQQIEGHLLEIGVFKGRSANALAAHVRPAREKIFLVDPSVDAGALRARLSAGWPQAASALELLLIRSNDLLKHPSAPPAKSVRFLHIDGGHTAQNVLEDLEIADALLAPEGVVVVDDFFNVGYTHLAQALFRWLEAHPESLSLFLSATNKAYLARPAAAPHYRHLLLEKSVRELELRMLEMTLWISARPGELDCHALIVREREGERLRGPDDEPEILHTVARRRER